MVWGPIAWSAIGSFVVVLLGALVVLDPRPEVEADISASEFERWAQADPSAHAHTGILSIANAARRRNAELIWRAHIAYRVALDAVAVEAALWIAQLMATM